MVTRGYEVYKFQGKHYTYYSSSDSYPSGLGENLVGVTRWKGFRDWIESKRNELRRADRVADQHTWTVSPEELVNAVENSKPLSFKSYERAKHYELCAAPSMWPPTCDLYIEWIYTINLDLDIFTVNNNNHFPLFSIPDNWSEYVVHRHEGPRFDGLPCSLNPGQVALELPESRGDSSLASAYSSLSVTVVEPKKMSHFEPGKRSAIQFARRLLLQWVDKLFGEIRYMIPQWSADDKAFREIAFMFLCFAAGLPDLVTFGNCGLFEGNKDHRVIGLGPRDNCHDSQVELVADVCSQFHTPRKSPWIAPGDECFWFHGVLVHLTTNMHCDDVTAAGIARLVEYGARTRGRSSFDGVVMSLEHVVLVRVLPGGQVERSQELPMTNFFKYESDTQPPTSIVEAELEASNSGPQKNEEKEALANTTTLITTEEPVEERDKSGLKSTRDTFAALAHMFEAQELERLRHVGESTYLPNDVLFMIIDWADVRTRQSLARVSRVLRRYCQQKYLVNDGDGAVLTDDGEDECFLTTPGASGGGAKYMFSPKITRRLNNLSTDVARREAESTQWTPIFGDERGRRALLWEAGFVFNHYTSPTTFIG